MNKDILNLIESFIINKDISINYTKEITPRVKVIIDFLKVNNIEFHLDQWKEGPRFLNNVYVKLENSENSKDEYRMFDAHHDVVNYMSENAQDNTCSVINLLLLAKKLSLEPINKNVLIVFTDGEEIKQGGMGSGAKRVLEYFTDLNIYSSYALELTGLGDIIWHNSKSFELEDSTILNCPFNNSTIYNNEISSTCIGILPKNEITQKFIGTWSLCHSINDTFDKCNTEDMINFINYLYHIANSDFVEVKENNDPIFKLNSLGIKLLNIYDDKIKVNISTDLDTGHLELLLLPTKRNSLLKNVYCIITITDNIFYIKNNNELIDTPIESVTNLTSYLERILITDNEH